jgi:hypothetical protein
MGIRIDHSHFPYSPVLADNLLSMVYRIGHDDSRKDAKHAKFGEIGQLSSLRTSRLGAINLLEFVLFNIWKVKI